MENPANPAQAKDEILRAIRLGDIAAAKEQFVQASERWRGAASLRLAEGSILEASGQLDLAEDLYRELQTQFPSNPWPGVRLAGLLRRQGRLAEAREIYERVIWSSSARSEIKSKLLDELARTTSSDVGEATAFLERLQAQASSDEPLVARVTAMLSARQGGIDDALAALGAAAQSEDSLALARDLLLRSNRIAEAQSIATALVEQYPDRPQHIRRLILLLLYSGQTEAAIESLATALRRWPSDWRLIHRLNRAYLPRPELAKLFKIIDANRAAAKMDPRALLQYAIAALHADENEAAHAVLDQIDPASSMEYLAAPLRRALSRWPRGWRVAGRFLDDPRSAVQTVRAPDAEATLFVFTGLVRGLSYLPLAYADSLLAEYRVNVVYLRDTMLTGYFKGIEGFGTDVQSTASSLRGIAAEFGVRTITLGASFGGFASVRFGALIGAQAAISLAGPTRLQMRRDPITSAKLYTSLSEEEKDLLPDIVSHPNLGVIYYYGQGNPADTEHAQRLLGIPNCTSRGVEGVNDHLVVLHMIGQGDFDRMLVDDLALTRRQ